MKAVIVTGDRNATQHPGVRRDWERVMHQVLSAVADDAHDGELLVLLHGACGLDAGAPNTGSMKGIDFLADQVGKELGFLVVPIAADWTGNGKSAGPRRNREMVRRLLQFRSNGSAVMTLAFHDAFTFSAGTRNCVIESFNAGIPARIYERSGQGRAYA